MGRIALFAAALAAAAACSKSDPVPTGTAPPRGGAERVGPGGAVKGGAEGAVAMPTDTGGGDPANDSSYKLATQQAAPAAAGAESIARLVVNPGPGYKMNLDFPTKLTLEPPAGVTLAKAVLEPADAESFDEKGLTFAVKMSAPSAGEYTIPATIKFAVCTEATCDPKKQKVALVLKAN
jgi:hypothetical protein